MWAGAIITKAKKEGRITDEITAKMIIDEINKYSTKCSSKYELSLNVKLIFGKIW